MCSFSRLTGFHNAKLRDECYTLITQRIMKIHFTNQKQSATSIQDVSIFTCVNPCQVGTTNPFVLN